MVWIRGTLSSDVAKWLFPDMRIYPHWEIVIASLKGHPIKKFHNFRLEKGVPITVMTLMRTACRASWLDFLDAYTQHRTQERLGHNAKVNDHHCHYSNMSLPFWVSPDDLGGHNPSIWVCKILPPGAFQQLIHAWNQIGYPDSCIRYLVLFVISFRPLCSSLIHCLKRLFRNRNS